MECPKCGNTCEEDPDVDGLYLCKTEGCLDYWTVRQQAEIDRLNVENERLRKGLQEFADEDNWEPIHTGLGNSDAWYPQHTSKAWNGGRPHEFAAAALSGKEEHEG